MGDVHKITQTVEEFADGLVKAVKETPYAHRGGMGQACLRAAVRLLVEEYGFETTRECLQGVANNLTSFPANDEDSGGPEAA
jgi:hypothetical protein